MAQRISGRFGFRQVTLVKSKENSLGIGSYGAVYKAKCDQLPCAAKVLHPILFETRDPAGQRIVQRFEQECQFLSEMRHPNVIQYLGTIRDPDSWLPVLLMELMDTSLTDFLEQSVVPLPYHIQINIACDIAQALAYLHSHEVIHRDLSSNNVLLIGNTRAKVTDFGMSKLSDATNVTTPRPLTQLPGTEVYMAPEAFLEPPEYTNKLDCFSFGVLGIQIITRKFPKPGPRRKQVNVPKSKQVPKGRAEVVVSEVERRNSHIVTIDSTHQLLLISLDCLNNDDKARPTAEDLCSQLSAVKETEGYRDSVVNAEASAALKEHVHQLQRELKQATERAEASEQFIAEFQESLERKDKMLGAMNDALRSRDEAVRRKDREIRDLQRALQAMRQGRELVREPLKLRWENRPSCPINTWGEAATVNGSEAYFRDGVSNSKILKYHSDTGEWSSLVCPKNLFSVAVVKGMVTAIGGKRSGRVSKTLLSLTDKDKWAELFPPMTCSHITPGVACANTSLIVAGGFGPEQGEGPVEVMNMETLTWSIAASLPHPWFQPTVTICGDRMYVAGGYYKTGKSTQSVLSCVVSDLLRSAESHQLSPKSKQPPALKVNSSADCHTAWQEVAELPVYHSTLVTFQDQLIALGGGDSAEKPTSAVHLYDESTNTWNIISHMNVKRRSCLAAVLPGDRLMVVGGWMKEGKSLTSVEMASLA